MLHTSIRSPTATHFITHPLATFSSCHGNWHNILLALFLTLLVSPGISLSAVDPSILHLSWFYRPSSAILSEAKKASVCSIQMRSHDLYIEMPQALIKSPRYTGGDFMFLYRFVRRRRRRRRCRRPQILVHARTFEQLFGFLSFWARLMALTYRLTD